ncbi:MAG: hypothetical protein PHW32_04885 [Bacilli bacterium]|nr:hypothetical protein [Bacilli bacterium]MDD4283161.1 hypothetical protein [Bacilli bacterium]MDD4719188.1 hypothetical protein [Bacilli bacterium]
MTKKQFLSELEIRLSVLNDVEKQDIINEYKDIIEEKIRNGKTIKEAIADFGDIDELTEEILKAYKINPNYNKKENNQTGSSNVSVGLESGIRKVAKKLAVATKQIVDEIKNSNNNNLTMEKVFEIVIKFFILMVILMFLKFPFHVLYNMGVVILDFGNNPIGTIILFAWKMIIWSIYFISCLALIYVFFQTQLKNIDDEKSIKKNKINKTNIQDKQEAILDDNINKKKAEPKHISNTGYILRAIIGITILLPLIFINISLYLGLTIVIYLMIKGIEIYGIFMIVVGLIFIFTNVYYAFSTFIYSKKKTYVFPYIIGIILITIGSLFTFDYISSIEYYDKLPEINANTKTVTYKEQIEGDLIVGSYYNNNVKLLVNKELQDNEVVIDVTYFDDYLSINKDFHHLSNTDKTFIGFYTTNRKGFRKVIIDAMNKLKKRKVYNYQGLFDIDIMVYANENTINKINKD